MKTLFMAFAIAALSLAQPADQQIVGSWTAKFEGRTFVRLEITSVNGVFGGGMSLGNIQLDPQGALKSVETAPSVLTPIFGVVRKGSIVTFFMKEGSDADEFQLRLREGADADLHFILNEADRKEVAESGVPLPKPIRLSKADAGRMRAGE
jgi:hypothetical protein